MSGLPYQTLRESVVSAIRMKIVNQDLKPGCRVVEQELADEFQTSRGPVREALRQLENEGLLEYTRNVGCTVRTISANDAYELYLLRADYEIVAVRMFQGKIPAQTIENMKQILKKLSELRASDLNQMYDLDNDFHGELLRMTKLEYLYKVWADLNYVKVLAGHDKKIDREKLMHNQYGIHKVILDACESGDCEKICTSITEHYWRTIRRMMSQEGLDETKLVRSWEHMVL